MVGETDQHDEEFAMTWLMMNIPLMVLFFALWVGVPVWLVLKRSDTRPEGAATAAISYLPAAQDQDLGNRRVA
jgi:hypothetical protein